MIEIIITSAADYQELNVVFQLMLKLLIREVLEVSYSTCAYSALVFLLSFARVFVFSID